MDGQREWQYLVTEDVKLDGQKVGDVWQIVEVEMKGEKWNVKDQLRVVLWNATRESGYGMCAWESSEAAVNWAHWVVRLLFYQCTNYVAKRDWWRNDCYDIL